MRFRKLECICDGIGIGIDIGAGECRERRQVVDRPRQHAHTHKRKTGYYYYSQYIYCTDAFYLSQNFLSFSHFIEFNASIYAVFVRLSRLLQLRCYSRRFGSISHAIRLINECEHLKVFNVYHIALKLLLQINAVTGRQQYFLSLCVFFFLLARDSFSMKIPM